MYDVIIIGAGIIGSFIAYDLSKFDLKVLVIDKENDVANATTMANSAIIHTGYDPKDNTLKAKLNVEGALMYEEICKRLNVPYQKVGAYVLGRKSIDSETFTILRNRASKRNIKYEDLDYETIHQNEKNVAPDIDMGLSFPDTAIIDPFLTAITLMDVAVNNGVTLNLSEEVKKIVQEKNYQIYTNKMSYQTKVVINASGLESEKIANMVGDNSFKINYYKGEYFVLSKDAKSLVNHIIYPVPSSVGKGVLVVPTVHQNTMIGPTSLLTSNSSDLNTTEAGLDLLKDKSRLLIKNIPTKEIIRSFAGIRPKEIKGDFIISESKVAKNFINLAGIDSPGIASAPAISDYVIEKIIKTILPLEKKKIYQIESKKYPKILDMSIEKRNELIKQNPKYGKIICRCEKITEQEIIDAINRPVSARTVKAIKKRVRAGMGKCQGGFCEPLIVKILERELNIKPTDVCYDDLDSAILMCKKGDNYDK